jgi:hypothetical protein
MSPEKATEKVKRAIQLLEDGQLLFLELKGEKVEKLQQYPQKNIDQLIDSINDDFISLAINNIKGEFL